MHGWGKNIAASGNIDQQMTEKQSRSRSFSSLFIFSVNIMSSLSSTDKVLISLLLLLILALGWMLAFSINHHALSISISMAWSTIVGWTACRIRYAEKIKAPAIKKPLSTLRTIAPRPLPPRHVITPVPDAQARPAVGPVTERPKLFSTDVSSLLQDNTSEEAPLSVATPPETTQDVELSEQLLSARNIPTIRSEIPMATHPIEQVKLSELLSKPPAPPTAKRDDPHATQQIEEVALVRQLMSTQKFEVIPSEIEEHEDDAMTMRIDPSQLPLEQSLPVTAERPQINTVPLPAIYETGSEEETPVYSSLAELMSELERENC